MPDGAVAPSDQAPRRDRACQTGFQGSEIEPMASERNAPPFWSILKSERY
jgi:hypothetical protein